MVLLQKICCFHSHDFVPITYYTYLFINSCTKLGISYLTPTIYKCINADMFYTLLIVLTWIYGMQMKYQYQYQ